MAVNLLPLPLYAGAISTLFGLIRLVHSVRNEPDPNLARQERFMGCALIGAGLPLLYLCDRLSKQPNPLNSRIAELGTVSIAAGGLFLASTFIQKDKHKNPSRDRMFACAAVAVGIAMLYMEKDILIPLFKSTATLRA